MLVVSFVSTRRNARLEPSYRFATAGYLGKLGGARSSSVAELVRIPSQSGALTVHPWRGLLRRKKAAARKTDGRGDGFNAPASTIEMLLGADWPATTPIH